MIKIHNEKDAGILYRITENFETDIDTNNQFVTFRERDVIDYDKERATFISSRDSAQAQVDDFNQKISDLDALNNS